MPPTRDASLSSAPRRPLRALLWASLIGLALLAGDLHAQPSGAISDDDKAAAQVLFDEGRALLKQEKYAEACAKLAESMRLDNAIGTQLNLADCYEKLGKTASAWINWVEAATRARKEGQDKRMEIAQEHADALEGKLSRMKVDVPYLLEGLTIKRDGVVVGEPQWGNAMPVDPGEHVIEASAPGKKTWKKTVKVGEENDNVEVTVPTLEDAPVDAPSPPPARDDNLPQIIGGVVAGSIGIVGLGLGIGFGVLAMNKNDESFDHCLAGASNMCTTEGVALRDEALTFSHVSTAGFVIAGAGIVIGAVLIGTAAAAADEDEETAVDALLVAPWLDPQSAGLSLGARW
jgi:hypothetical protein